MTRRDTRTPEQQELDERIERAAEREARLDETLTRREVLDALEHVTGQYSPYHHSTLIELLNRIAKALS